MIHDSERERTPVFWAAPELIDAGYKVFPVDGKAPTVEGGFYGATVDKSQVAAWIEDGRGDHDIAVPTGVFGGLVVIDADDKESYDKMVEKYGPPTYTTKRGGHWLFKHPRNGKVVSNKIAPGLDRKGDLGYVIFPPSKGRTWTNGIARPEDLPELPREFWSKTKGPTPGERTIPQERKEAAAAIIAERVREITPGPERGRHEHLRHLCGALLRQEVSLVDAEDILKDAWSKVGGDLSERAEREVPNTLATTQAAMAAGGATGGPNMEKITPGLYAELEEAMEWPAPASITVGSSSGLPKILVNNRHLRDMTADALGALEAANTPPQVFVRSGRLVRIQDDENGTPVITALNDNHVKGRLARVADCVKVYKDKNEVRETRVSPPDVVVRDIQALDTFPFPPLEAVVETPVVRPDGTIFDTPGYDPATRLYYHPAPGFAPPAVPDHPTAEDQRRALAVLHEAVGEFPYADGSSAANTLALMLTGLLRQAVDLVPLALIDKPQAGTGGSLLAEVVALVGTGRPAEMFGAPSRDDEWGKKLTAKFAGGSTMLIIDNVDGALYAPSLARALTSRSWTDRVLGLSEMITVRQRATWIATGNNIQLQGDLPRRCYWVRLDAKASRPWEREGFKHPDLLRWVEENRDQLVHALLTLVRSWYAAGKPKDATLPRLGSFEAWAETVGGVLAHAGIEGFLGNLEALYSKADEGGAEWEAFLDAWWRTWGEDGKTVKAVAEAATKADGLGDALPGELAEALGKNQGSFTRKLGKALASRIGTRYGAEGLHVEETGTHRRSKVWSVFKGSDGPKGTKECEFVSLVSLFESNAGEKNKTSVHNEEINYPPPPQTNSTNSQTHTPPGPVHTPDDDNYAKYADDNADDNRVADDNADDKFGVSSAATPHTYAKTDDNGSDGRYFGVSLALHTLIKKEEKGQGESNPDLSSPSSPAREAGTDETPVIQPEDVRLSKERADILLTLNRSPSPMTPKNVSDVTPGTSYGSVKKLMWTMLGDGQLLKDDKGRYYPTNPTTPTTPGNPGNRGNPGNSGNRGNPARGDADRVTGLPGGDSGGNPTFPDTYAENDASVTGVTEVTEVGQCRHGTPGGFPCDECDIDDRFGGTK
jgi:hypothetical protein